MSTIQPKLSHLNTVYRLTPYFSKIHFMLCLKFYVLMAIWSYFSTKRTILTPHSGDIITTEAETDFWSFTFSWHLTLQKCHLSFKQQLPLKSSQFGIMTIRLRSSTTWYTWSFLVYSGKNDLDGKLLHLSKSNKNFENTVSGRWGGNAETEEETCKNVKDKRADSLHSIGAVLVIN
jgi:hypothetical protein